MDGSADQILVDQVCMIVFADLVAKRPGVAETPGLRDYIKEQALNLCSAGQRDIEQLARYAQARTLDWLNSPPSEVQFKAS
ncbi:MAG TPA: hypothetical protein VK934_10280 [Fimbriimonas sp.]|nr:hypothetical protein [Fimbriimonas sp.]